jgi:hypothetical protein
MPTAVSSYVSPGSNRRYTRSTTSPGSTWEQTA